MNKRCPTCGKVYRKFIYMGLSLRMCEDSACSTAEGPALWLMEHIPPFTQQERENGWALFEYEGSYWRGLWEWLTYKDDEGKTR